MQYELDLISHRVDGQLIEQRKQHGYINATTMCRAGGKLFSDYARIGPTKSFLRELSSDMGIPITELIQSVRGGDPTIQGTWVHPQVAVHLGQWLAPRFAVQVSKWVYDWLSGRCPADAADALSFAEVRSGPQERARGSFLHPCRDDAGHHCANGRRRIHTSREATA